MYHIFCIHSSVEGHLGSFQLLAVINKAAMNIVDNASLLHDGSSSGYILKIGIVGSSYVSNFLRKHQIDFQNVRPIFLMNIDKKVLIKMLVNQIQEHIKDIIQQNQRYRDGSIYENPSK